MGITDRALAVIKQWTTKTKEPGKLPLPTKDERKTRQHTQNYVHQDWYLHARDLPLFTFQTVREMLRDPQVRLCLAMRQAPIFGVEFAYIDGVGQDGKPTWVPGVKARNPIVAAWVQRQLQTIWNNYLPHLLASQTWGWAGGEVTLRLTEANLIEIDTLHPRHPKDIRMLELKSSGDPWGIEVKNVSGEGTVQLPFPYSYFVRFRPENGEKYSSSVLIGAYSPWADKWLNGAALDTRRLYMHKDAYGGMKVGYPSDQQVYVNGPDRDPVPARDVALQIAEQRYSGGTIVYPTDHDMNGNAKWQVDDATVASNPQHILQYPKDLDNEIRQGLEIPDGAISNDGSGAWEGKSIPLAAFFSGIDTWVTQILSDLRMVLDPLVLLNWGTAEEYEITHKPLGLQAMEQQGAKRDGNGAMGPMDPMQQQQMDQQSDPYRMSIDPVAAVGRGALKAVDVVKAARTALGYDTDITTMAAMRAPKGYSKDSPLIINSKHYVGGMFIPGDQLEHATGDQMDEIKSGVKKADTPAVEDKPSDIKPEATKYEAVETGPGTAHEKTSKLIANNRSVKLKNGHAIKVQYDRSSRDNTGYRVTHTDPDKNKTEHPERFATLEEAASFAATMLQNKQLEAKAKSQKQEAEPTKPGKVAKASPTVYLRDDDTPVDPTSKDVFTVPVGSLKTDAKRFQYKVKDIDADGVTQELKSVGKWNPELAGALLVWRDPETGIDYVVNGHHRHDLARRLGADTLNVRYIDAENALQARARGALANIAEGRGSSIDAAKYLRDTNSDVEHLKDAGISLAGKVAFEATILKNLADKPFQMVTQGTLEESKAIAVAKHLKDHDLQNALFKKLEDREEDGKEWNTREIETAAKKMGNAGKYVEKGQDLFGMFEDEQSTFDQEVELESHVARFLGQEARDFRAISSQKRADRVSDAGNTLAVDENLKRAIAAEEAAANFEREAGLRGPISALIKEQAVELAQAKTKKQKEAIKEQTFAKIKEAQRAMGESIPAVAEPDTMPTQAESIPEPQREGHELKQNASGKWAWFKDGQQKTGAFETQQDAMSDPMMEAIESNAIHSRKVSEKSSKQADASEFQSSDQLWNHLSNTELQQMIDRDREAAKGLQNDREFDGMGGRRSGPAMANQGARETFETSRKMQRYLDERQKADVKPQATDSMKNMRISERKTYASDLAKQGMAQTEIADHLMSRGLVSADAKKLASDATYEANSPVNASSDYDPRTALKEANAKMEQVERKAEPLIDQEQRIKEMLREVQERKVPTQKEMNQRNRDLRSLNKKLETVRETLQPMRDELWKLSDEGQKHIAAIRKIDEASKPESSAIFEAKAVVDELETSGDSLTNYAKKKNLTQEQRTAVADEFLRRNAERRKQAQPASKPPSDARAAAMSKFEERNNPIQSPGISMPSTTKPIEEANAGDQLGLFGEAFVETSRKANMKVEDPTRARQSGLFDTKGNANQMDLFGDGVMPDDLVYKPKEAKKQTSSTGNEALDWIRDRTKPMKSFGDNLRDEPTDMPNSGIFEGQLPKHMRNQLHEFAKSRATRTQTGKLNDIIYNLVGDDGRRYTLNLDHRTGDAKLTFDHRDDNE